MPVSAGPLKPKVKDSRPLVTERCADVAKYAFGGMSDTRLMRAYSSWETPTKIPKSLAYSTQVLLYRQ